VFAHGLLVSLAGSLDNTFVEALVTQDSGGETTLGGVLRMCKVKTP
jgi:hypothetical protein